MKIALDYDGTYTVDRRFWDNVIDLALAAGHEIAFVTKRYPEESIEVPHGVKVYYMSRRLKLNCMFHPDIWIDNNPIDIVKDSVF